jgi:DNA-binding transcriptional regulator YiaG
MQLAKVVVALYASNIALMHQMQNETHKKFVPDLHGIGRRIREIRGFDRNQREFAQLLGIGQTQLSRLENGQSAPTIELLLKLKADSGKSTDWILTGEMQESGRRSD